MQLTTDSQFHRTLLTKLPTNHQKIKIATKKAVFTSSVSPQHQTGEKDINL